MFYVGMESNVCDVVPVNFVGTEFTSSTQGLGLDLRQLGFRHVSSRNGFLGPILVCVRVVTDVDGSRCTTTAREISRASASLAANGFPSLADPSVVFISAPRPLTLD